MQAKAIAQPNIALIKYWGKRDTERNLPAVGSISLTLASLFTEMAVDLDTKADRDALFVNEQPAAGLLPRVSRCLDTVLGERRPRALVRSRNNFPLAAGLASSASAFAALVRAAAAAAGTGLEQTALSQLAGRASGSAARSIYGGYVELDHRGDDVQVQTLLPGADWPLEVVVAITTPAAKAVGSTEAMERSRRTSPFYTRWVEQQDADLDAARAAILDRDFARLATVAEHNCLKMHSVMWASRPPMIYWNAATLACMQTIRDLQREGAQVFFTIDAGPQLKAVCLPGDAAAVRAALAVTDGVVDTMQTGLGEGARLVTD